MICFLKYGCQFVVINAIGGKQCKLVNYLNIEIKRKYSGSFLNYN